MSDPDSSDESARPPERSAEKWRRGVPGAQIPKKSDWLAARRPKAPRLPRELGAYAPPPDEQEQEQRRTWRLPIGGRVAGIIGVVLVILVLFGLLDRHNRSIPSVPSPPADLIGDGATHSIRYEVTGRSSASDINYDNGHLKDQPLPWSHTTKAFTGEPVVLIATGAGRGDITCKVYEDGTLLASQTRTGQFAVCDVDSSVR